MNIVLFDMDGTLTEPRQKMSRSMVAALTKLQKNNFNIGIVTGSGMHYLKEQCLEIFEDFSFDHEKVYYFPCNGTQYIRYENRKEKVVYSTSMEEEIGTKDYRDIIYMLIENQLRIKRTLYGKLVPLTGNFIDCRGSMINWCPIGRNATHDDRKKWVELDQQHNIRNNFIDCYFRSPIYESVEVKLGGSTSFDIFPLGWDKTYALRNFKKEEEVWFVGDKCDELGNDKELYDAIKLRSSGESFKTNGPIKTIEIIEKFILSQPR